MLLLLLLLTRRRRTVLASAAEERCGARRVLAGLDSQLHPALDTPGVGCCAAARCKVNSVRS